MNVIVDRAALIERIETRLAEADAETLAEIDRMIEYRGVPGMPAIAPPEPQQDTIRLSRRQALLALLTGGTAMAGTAVAAGWVGVEQGYGWGTGDRSAAANAEVDQLRRLVGMYEALERIKLDEIVGAGLASSEG